MFYMRVPHLDPSFTSTLGIEAVHIACIVVCAGSAFRYCLIALGVIHEQTICIAEQAFWMVIEPLSRRIHCSCEVILNCVHLQLLWICLSQLCC